MFKCMSERIPFRSAVLAACVDFFFLSLYAPVNPRQPRAKGHMEAGVGGGVVEK